MNKKNLFFFIMIVIFIYISPVYATEISCRYEMNENGHNEKFVLKEEYEGSKKLKLMSNNNYMKISKDGIYLNADNTCPSVSLYYGTGGKIVYQTKKLCEISEILPNFCSSNLIGVKKEDDSGTDNNFIGKYQAALVTKTSDTCEYKNEKDGESYIISIINPEQGLDMKVTKVKDFYYFTKSSLYYLTTQGKYFSIKDGRISCPSYIYLEKKYKFFGNYGWQYVIVDKSNENDSNQTEIENPILGDNNEVQQEPTPKPSENVDCNGIFANEFGEYLKQIYDLLKFAIPIIILGYAIVDFLKALAAQDAAEVKKAANKLVKRLIIGVLIFVLPTILEFFLDLAGVQFGVCDLGS